MNTFKIQIKQDGEFADLKATSVFPFSWGELLDARLDEAYLAFYNSPKKAFKPLTEFKDTLDNGGTAYDMLNQKTFCKFGLIMLRQGFDNGAFLLTLTRRYDIIMAWDKSKHPRDEDGKITSGKGSPKTYRQNTSYSEIISRRETRGDIISRVTKKQWTMWYDAIGNIERGMWFPSNDSGYIIQIENKFFITSVSYENPTLVDIWELTDNDEAQAYLEELIKW